MYGSGFPKVHKGIIWIIYFRGLASFSMVNESHRVHNKYCEETKLSLIEQKWYFIWWVSEFFIEDMQSNLKYMKVWHTGVEWRVTEVWPVCSASRHTGDNCRVTAVWPAVLCQLIHGCWLFSYSPLNTRVSGGWEQLVTLLLLSIHSPWISWQSTAGHTSVTLHADPRVMSGE
jgi:hypothetical protein